MILNEILNETSCHLSLENDILRPQDLSKFVPMDLAKLFGALENRLLLT